MPTYTGCTLQNGAVRPDATHLLQPGLTLLVPRGAGVVVTCPLVVVGPLGGQEQRLEGEAMTVLHGPRHGARCTQPRRMAMPLGPSLAPRSCTIRDAVGFSTPLGCFNCSKLWAV